MRNTLSKPHSYINWRARLAIRAAFIVTTAVVAAAEVSAASWTPMIVDQDPLVRMPGTQPKEVTLPDSSSCVVCHSPNGKPGETGFSWQGSMMAQSSRDFLFWASMTVAEQDSIWAFGRPNAADLCERCHLPKGWLEGRSDPVNASKMKGYDFDGVQCTVCHTMYDPFFAADRNGKREHADSRYWDETNASATPSKAAAEKVYAIDKGLSAKVKRFDGQPFFGKDFRPFSPEYTENGAGQYFMTGRDAFRGPFADANAPHDIEYSRYLKSKYFCSTCHDVSNPAIANIKFKDAKPGPGGPILPTEKESAYRYTHSERTFSEFMVSVYGRTAGGATGTGAYAPDHFKTSLPGNRIARCQDCHMPQVHVTDPNEIVGLKRPDQSKEHPHSAMSLHDLTGGSLFVPAVLASAVPGSPNYDAANAKLLDQGHDALTVDMKSGLGLNAPALLDAVKRAKQELHKAATIDHVTYDPKTGKLSFRIVNHTGHKLISGYPEGRRMFVEVRAFKKDKCIFTINPYDSKVGTLKGLDHHYSPESPPLNANERYVDRLVYETLSSSSFTKEKITFHFALATSSFKDNRIPPRGFDIHAAAKRLAEPDWNGAPAPDYFTPEEYAGGYDQESQTIPAGADRIEIRLYYQTTSREYIEFLRDEINGVAKTLPSPTPSGQAKAYIIQTDPFFKRLKAWGDTVWKLWDHNKNMPGAAPVLMTQAQWKAA